MTDTKDLTLNSSSKKERFIIQKLNSFHSGDIYELIDSLTNTSMTIYGLRNAENYLKAFNSVKSPNDIPYYKNFK